MKQIGLFRIPIFPFVGGKFNLLSGLLLSLTLLLSGCFGNIKGSVSDPTTIAAQGFLISPNPVTVSLGGAVEFKASGGVEPIQWAVETGPGLVEEKTGVFKAPDVVADVVVKATDANGSTAFAAVRVVDIPVIMPTEIKLSVENKFSFSVAGGVGPYKFIVADGEGSIDEKFGAFTASANPGSAKVRVTDAAGAYAEATVTVVNKVQMDPKFTDLGTQDVRVYDIKEGVAPFKLELGAGKGFVDSLNRSYQAPNEAGTAVVSVTDSLGNMNFSVVTVVDRLQINPSSAMIAKGTNFTFTFLNGKGPFSFGASGGTITQQGVFTAPDKAGEYEVWVTDATKYKSIAKVTVTDSLTFSVPSIVLMVNDVYDFSVNGGVAPYTYTVPQGQGTIVGNRYTAPNVPGEYTVKVTDSQAPMANSVTAVVKVNPALAISPKTVSLSVTNEQVFSSTGGVPPYTYSIKSGTGTVDPNSGLYKPSTVPGTTVVMVTDSRNHTAEATVTVQGPLAINPTSIKLAVNSTYVLNPGGGVQPYIVTPTRGTMVEPLKYKAPATAGTDVVTIKDQSGNQTVLNVEVVDGLTLVPMNAQVRIDNPFKFTATGGVEPYTWEILDSNSQPVSGKGTIDATGNFVAGSEPALLKIRVKDSQGISQVATLIVYGSIKIDPPYRVTMVSTPTKTKQETFTISGGAPPYAIEMTPANAVTLTKVSEDLTAAVPTVTYKFQTPPEAALGGNPFLNLSIKITDSTRDPVTNNPINQAIATFKVNGLLNMNPNPLVLAPSNIGEVLAEGGIPPYSFTVAPKAGSTAAFNADYGNILQTGSSKVQYTAGAVPGSLDLKVKDSDNNEFTSTILVNSGLLVTPAETTIAIGATKAFSIFGGVEPYTVTSSSPNGTIGAVTKTGSTYNFNFTAGTVTEDITLTIKDKLNNSATVLIHVFNTLTITPTPVTVAVTKTQVFVVNGGYLIGGQDYTFTLFPAEGTFDVGTRTYTAPASTTVNSVTLTVKDSANNSAVATINLKKRATITTVTSSKPDACYKAGEVIPIVATFSEDVTFDSTNGSPTLKLETGANDVEVPFTRKVDNRNYEFTYTVLATENTNDLDYFNNTSFIANGATFRDSVGLDADLNLAKNASGVGLLAQVKNICIDNEYPMAEIKNAPTGISSVTPIDVFIEDKIDERGVGKINDVANYRYKIEPTSTIDCSVETGYSASQPLATRITTDLKPFGDVGITLCVVGVDTAGNWQPFTSATRASWERKGTAPIAKIYNAPIGVNNIQNINIDIGDAGEVFFYKYKMGVNQAADYCSQATGYSAELTENTNIVQSISTMADGVITLCVVGADNLNPKNWQPYSIASSVSWRKKRPATIINVTTTKPNGCYNAGVEIPLTVVFSEPVNLDATNGNPTLKLESGTSDIEVAYTRKVDGTTFEFNYTVLQGHASDDLDYFSNTALISNGGQFVDAVGAVADLALFKNASGVGFLATNKQICIDTEYPIAELKNAPSGISSVTPLDVTVEDKIDERGVGKINDVSVYRYKIGNADTTDCAVEAGYSATPIPVATKITDDVKPFGDVGIALCVVGGDTAGNWQPFSGATKATWVRKGTAPIAKIYNAPTGPSNQTLLDVSIGDAPDLAYYKYKIGVNVGTAADWCAISSGYSAIEIAQPTKITNNISSLADGVVVLCVVGADSFSPRNWQPYIIATVASWVKKTIPPVLTFTNTPTTVSRDSVLNVDAGGTGVFTYRYKLGIPSMALDTTTKQTNFCTDPIGYSDARPENLNITDGTLADGIYVLCGVALDEVPNQQAFASATKYVWTRDSRDFTVNLTTTAQVVPQWTNANVPVVAELNKQTDASNGFAIGDVSLTVVKMKDANGNNLPNPTLTQGSWPTGSNPWKYNFTIVTDAQCADCEFQVNVNADVALDLSKFGNLVSNTLHFKVDKVKPSVILSEILTRQDSCSTFYLPQDGGVGLTFTMKATVPSDVSVIGFDATDVKVTGTGTALINGFRKDTTYAGAGSVYLFDVTPKTEGTINIAINAGAFTDLAGNGNTASNQIQHMFDMTPPPAPVITSMLDIGQAGATRTLLNMRKETPKLYWNLIGNTEPNDNGTAGSGVDDATGYQLQIVQRPENTVLGTSSNFTRGSNVNWPNDYLANNSAFYFRLVAVDKACNQSDMAISNDFFTDTVPPSAPSNLLSGALAYSAHESPTAQWLPAFDDLSGVTKYQIAINLGGQGIDGTRVIDWQDQPNSLWASYVQTTDFLSTGLNYFTGIRAVDAYGNISGEIWSSAWTQSIDCPQDFIYIAGNPARGVSSFCIARYETAKSNGPKLKKDAQIYTAVTRAEAKNQCATLGNDQYNGTILELPTNDQWNTIAGEIYNQPLNWSGGAVGGGTLLRGNSDSQSYVSTNDTGGATYQGVLVVGSESDPFYRTNNQANPSSNWGDQKRTFLTSNRSAIWDFAGNAAEWIQDEIWGQTLSPALVNGSWPIDFNVTTYFPRTAGLDGNYKMFIPTTISIDPIQSNYLAGKFTGGGLGAVLRGGNYQNRGSNFSGIFATDISVDPGSKVTVADRGFRCATPNLHIPEINCDNQMQVNSQTIIEPVGGFVSYTFNAVDSNNNNLNSNFSFVAGYPYKRYFNAPNYPTTVTISVTDRMGNSTQSSIRVYDLSAPAGKITMCATGSLQTFTLPSGASSMTVKAWGAGGGGVTGGRGGAGGHVAAQVNASSGTNFEIYVGLGGKIASSYSGAAATGGGLSAVLLGSTREPIVVAGAGGGSAAGAGIGGAGGGLAGQDAENGSTSNTGAGIAQGGIGATSSAAGLGGNSGANTNGESGGKAGIQFDSANATVAVGGDGCGTGATMSTSAYIGGGRAPRNSNQNVAGGGGGAGYFGGGGGGCGGQISGSQYAAGSGGGGGSSYVGNGTGVGATPITSQKGSGVIPGGYNDADYSKGSGMGGVGSMDGGAGRVVIEWN